MSAKIQGGSVFPNPRLSPSGPLLSGEGGPIIQIGFDQAIFTTDPAVPYVFPALPVSPGHPTEAEILASKIPRDVNDPTGDFLSVTLRTVKKGSLIAAWFSFGAIHVGVSDEGMNGACVFALGFDDGDGNDPGLIGFAVQTVVLDTAGQIEQGSIVTLGPNPYGEQRDVRLFPLAFSSIANVGEILPVIAQNALLAAEIAKV
jgi:hypothetical protein